MQRLLILALSFLILYSCKKSSLGLETDAVLSFSTSEVMFDTVFTGIGSATKRFLVYNRSEKDIQISKVFLEQGSSSQFRFNLDGVEGEQQDVIIAGNDSAFVFVEVTVNTGDKSLPFVIEDNLTFITNGQTQKVKTTAWGQDAYYYFPNTSVEGLPAFSRITDYKYQPVFGDVITWKNDKPHVIYGYLRVDSSITLKVEAGTQVHLHEGAGLWIASSGSIQVNGELDNEVVFQGDRLEDSFDELPGQWDRIWINEGAASSFKYAIIKNGYVGIQAETTPFNPGAVISDKKLTLQKTTIKNMVGIGLFTRNYRIEAENCLIYESGNQCLAVNGGGEYNFKHCTFANYWSGNNRQQPLLFINNYYQDLNGVTQSKDLDIRFDNSIFYGTKDEEVELDSSVEAGYQIVFNHCLMKTEINLSTNGDRYLNCIANPFNGFSSPVFTNPGADEYELYSGSSAQDQGDVTIPPAMVESDDILGKTRDAKPDLGCYEYQH